jgi:acyl carrier protein
MSIEEQVKSFIAERFLFDGNAPVDPERSLIEAGLLDSTGVMELVVFLEDRFRIKVADSELVPKNLDTIAGIGRFVRQKSAGTTPGTGSAAGAA